MHTSEKNSLILKYKQKLGILFDYVTYIIVVYFKNENPSIVFSTAILSDEEINNIINSMDMTKITKTEKHKATTELWITLFEDVQLHYG